MDPTILGTILGSPIFGDSHMGSSLNSGPFSGTPALNRQPRKKKSAKVGPF